MTGIHDAHHFLVNLAVLLCVAGVTTALFQALRPPVVLGYPAASADGSAPATAERLQSRSDTLTTRCCAAFRSTRYRVRPCTQPAQP